MRTIQSLIKNLRDNNRENVLEYCAINDKVDNPFLFFLRRYYRKRLVELAGAISRRTEEMKELKEELKKYKG